MFAVSQIYALCFFGTGSSGAQWRRIVLRIGERLLEIFRAPLHVLRESVATGRVLAWKNNLGSRGVKRTAPKTGPTSNWGGALAPRSLPSLFFGQPLPLM